MVRLRKLSGAGVRLAFCCLLGLAPCAARELAVQQEQADLLAECKEGGPVIAKLPKGQVVKLRFALAGASGRCYSVSTEVDGRAANGYVLREALAGLDEFEQERREASSAQFLESAIKVIGLPTIGRSGQPSEPSADPAQEATLLRAAAELKEDDPAAAERILARAQFPPGHSTAARMRATALLQLSRPREAREVIQAALRTHPDDPRLLAMAGMASRQLDDLHAARAYLKRSLAVQHDPLVEKVHQQVEREFAADKSDDKTYGSRFVLRYEGEALPAEAVRKLTAVFDREMNRISYQLGCPITDRLAVIIQTRENYRNATGAADWSGGRYDGRIRIVLPPSGEVDGFVSQTFAHEMVHACLARLGSWPVWLHEGLAQRLSGDKIDAQGVQLLRSLARENKLPSLERLAGSWARFSGIEARVAYTLALAAADSFFDIYREYGVRNLMNNPSRLPEITANLDRHLRERFQ